jgi:hypothetical protein
MGVAAITAIGLLGGEVNGMWDFIEGRVAPALAGGG